MKKTKTLTIEQALKAANSSKNQDIKGKFVAQHVHCNVNSLCEYIINKGFEDSNAPFTLDDLHNYYSYPEYRGTYAAFYGGNDDQRKEEIERLKESAHILIDNPKWGFDESLTRLIDDQVLDIESEIEELEALETEPAEIFEWWAISQYLFEKLKDLGYCVVDAGSCYIWGRTTTGQAVLLDHCISKICAEMEILEGQSNSWA